MAVSYNKLWKLLIDKKMSRAELRRAASISPNTMTKLTRDEEVSMAVMGRICDVLETNIGEVMDFIPEKEN
ncbi:MAG: helix-turn-helix transcriptional regulator [Clostridia bacterium]|nr:helix-turn-helix transcriptional regulator [Clostridia bacterium]